MDSSMERKIIKAREYAEQPERIHVHSFTAEIEGHDRNHEVSYQDGEWSCDCGYFQGRQVCAHTMAMERVMRPMMSQSPAGV